MRHGRTSFLNMTWFWSWKPSVLSKQQKRGGARERELNYDGGGFCSSSSNYYYVRRKRKGERERVGVAPLTLFHQGLGRPVVVVQHAAWEHVIRFVPLVVQWDPFFGIHFLKGSGSTATLSSCNLIMTTHLTSWSSKMSFHRGNKKSSTNSRSNSPLGNNSPSLSHAQSSTRHHHHPNAGVRSQSQATTAPNATNPTTSSTLSLTEKDFVEKGK